MTAVARQFDGVNRQSLGTWDPTIAPAARWTIRVTRRDQDG
jgi:hypothetical protein